MTACYVTYPDSDSIFTYIIIIIIIILETFFSYN